MKFLLCLICLITVSCNAVIDPKSETIRSEDGYYIGTAHKFKFEGHDYISFTKDRGVARIFSTLLSVGMSNLACTTYSKCISCGKTKEL